MLFMFTLPISKWGGGAREAILESTTDAFRGLGCYVAAGLDGPIMIENPILGAKPKGRLSPLSSIDRIDIKLAPAEIRVIVYSRFRFIFSVILGLAVIYNLIVRVNGGSIFTHAEDLYLIIGSFLLAEIFFLCGVFNVRRILKKCMI